MSTDPYVPASDPNPALPPLGSGDPVPAGGDSITTPQPKNKVKFTRAAALWAALVIGFFILIVLLIFIAQNTESAQFGFLGWHWSLPLGVAILGAAVGGGLLTVAVGAVRMLQLRREAKKNAKFRR